MISTSHTVASPTGATYIAQQIGKDSNGKPKIRLTHDYDRMHAIRNSALTYLAKSPRHYKAFMDGEYKIESKPLYIGQLLHLATLEPEKAHWELKLPRKGKGIDQRIEEQQQRAAENNIYLLSEAEITMLEGILNTVEKTPHVKRLIQEAEAEKSIYWQHRGLACKGKLDLIKRKEYIADLKFVIDADPREFIRKADRYYDYDRQMAFYRLGARACKLADAQTQCFFIAIEKSPPYPITIIEVKESALRRGEEKYERLFDRYLDTVAKGEYPAYPLNTAWTNEQYQEQQVENFQVFSISEMLGMVGK